MWSDKDAACSSSRQCPPTSRHYPQFCCIPKRKSLFWNSSQDISEAYDLTSGLVTCRRLALQKTGILDHTSVKTSLCAASNYSCNFGHSPGPLEKPLVTVRHHVTTSAHNVLNASTAVLQQQNSRHSTWQTYASLRKPTVLLPQLRDRNYYVSRPILAPPAPRQRKQWSTHTRLRALSALVISA